MSRPLRISWLVAATIVCVGCANPRNAPVPPGPVWHGTFDRPVQFHTVVDDGLLVVGTARHLYGVDANNGATLWRERNVNPNRQDVFPVDGKGSLLITDAAGGRFDDSDTHVLSIAKNDGLLIWESPILEGKAQHGVVSSDQSKLYLTTVSQPHGDDRGFMSGALPGKGLHSGLRREPRLVALDLDSGEIRWQQEFGRTIRLRPVGQPGSDSERPFDLGGYHRPLLLADLLCVTYQGILCVHSDTGELAWQHKFSVVEDDLALAYSNPVVDGDALFVTGANRVHALDARTGDVFWRSSRANILPELLTDGAVVYAQLGGRFFDLDRERWVWRGEFGAMAIDRKDGKTLWRYDDAHDSITNMLVLDDRIWMADEDRLFALDRKTGEQALSVRHRMREAPVFTVVNASGQVVLVGQSEVSAFARSSGASLWKVHHPPPRPAAWRRLSAQLLQVSGTLLKVTSGVISVSSGLVPSIPAIPLPAGVGLKLFSSKRMVRNTTGRIGDQFMDTGDSLVVSSSFAELQESYQYFLTTRKDYDGVLLAAVDINTGETSLTALPATTPDIVIDDAKGIVFQADGADLLAIPIR